jgi:2-dehydropantoate 2-reductase
MIACVRDTARANKGTHAMRRLSDRDRRMCQHRPMNALIVGAGAVGQVYGRHLALGGAHVYYFVREKYAEECRRGFAFYPLNRRKPRAAAVRMSVAPGDILTSVDEVKAIRFDQVYLCVASHQLHGPWLGELVAAIGDATVVSLQPGREDRDVILRVVPVDRLVAGMITVISYHAPLPGETVPEPGMAYWFPPLQPAPFSGPVERTRAVVGALRAGKQPATIKRDVPAMVIFPSALLMVLLTALERARWSFRELKAGAVLPSVRPAVAEAFAIIQAEHGTRAPRLLGMITRPFWLRRIITLARWVLPLDAETYFRVHFTKVNEQTRMFMRAYIEQGAKLGTPTNALRALEEGVTAAAA